MYGQRPNRVLLILCTLTVYYSGFECGVMAITATATFNMDGVTGIITFVQSPPNDNRTTVLVALSGLHQYPTERFPWHVHEYPFMARPDACSAVSVGGHFDPLMASNNPNYSSVCSEDNPLQCEVGDLSGKFGRLPAVFDFIMFRDSYLPLYGIHSIVGRSVVIHHGDGARWVCANIDYLEPLDDVTIAYSPLRSVLTGNIYFIQPLVMNPTTTVFTRLSYLNGSVDSTGHNWHVHENTIGSTGNCDDGGPHYNSRGISTNELTYEKYCNPSNQTSCEIGDLSGKSSQLDFINGYSTLLYSDTELPLRVNTLGESIVGRSVVVHAKDSGALRIACANISEYTPRTAIARFQEDGVSGQIIFHQVSPFSPTTITVELTGLSSRASGYHVHDFPVDETAPGSEKCANSFAGDHFNPRNVVRDTSSPITFDAYEIGDLSGKYGSLADQDSINVIYSDPYLSLFGVDSIVGRSIVIHYPNGSRWLCANIKYNMNTVSVTVNITSGTLQGKLVLTQLANDPFSETMIYLDLSVVEATNTTTLTTTQASTNVFPIISTKILPTPIFTLIASTTLLVMSTSLPTMVPIPTSSNSTIVPTPNSTVVTTNSTIVPTPNSTVVTTSHSTVVTTNSTIIPTPNSTLVTTSNSTAVTISNSTIVPTLNSTVVTISNSTIVPTPNSTLVTTSNSTIVPTPNSTMVTTPNSTVVTTSNSAIVPTLNSTVVTTSNSTIVSTPNSTMVTTPNSTVVTTSNSAIVPTLNSTVVTTSNSTIVSTPNSTMVTTPNSTVVTTSNSAIVPTLNSIVVTTSNSAIVPTLNSTVVTTSNSTIVSTPISTVVTTPNSTVVTTSNSAIVLTLNSIVVTTSNSTIVPTPNSTVVATSNSTIVPTPNSTVVATSNSTIVPTPNSTVSNSIIATNPTSSNSTVVPTNTTQSLPSTTLTSAQASIISSPEIPYISLTSSATSSSMLSTTVTPSPSGTDPKKKRDVVKRQTQASGGLIHLSIQTSCEEEAPVFNPYHAPLTCSLDSQLACPVGDLTGKHGVLSERSLLTDLNLPLTGPYAIVGSHLVVRVGDSSICSPLQVVVTSTTSASTITSISASSSVATATPTSAGKESDDNKMTIIIAAGAAGGFVVFLLLLFAICCCVWRRRHKRRQGRDFATRSATGYEPLSVELTKKSKYKRKKSKDEDYLEL
ncbi:uncharacterized protein [Dysidea avara]|uniref:uncharacterized protein n=1 Tax=Dysidea avara TaxID=196820 RepID=UPI0033236C1D